MNRRKQLSYRIKKWFRQLTWQDVKKGWWWVIEVVVGALLFAAMLWLLPLLG